MQSLEIKTPDGVADARFFQPSGSGPWPGVLFLMDGVGLRDALNGMAARLAAQGYAVLMPNLYYRHGPYAPFDAKTVFQPGSPDRDRMISMVRSLDSAMATRDLAAFLEWMAHEPRVRKGPVGAMGYCLGGGLAFRAAGAFPDRVAAVAAFHGSRLLTDQPDSPHRLIPKMKAQVYLGVAEIDQMHTPEISKQLEAALTAAGVPHQLETYPKAAHGFAVTDTAVYDPAAAERGWERMLALFGKALA